MANKINVVVTQALLEAVPDLIDLAQENQTVEITLVDENAATEADGPGPRPPKPPTA